MANHKSALKRAEQNIQRLNRNKVIKTKVKNIVKNIRLAANEKDKEVLSMLNTTKSLIDKAARKGIIHKKTASRKISRLSTLINTI
ncbi:MAG: 30S ribosomal protein S20 [Deltaproteobacteria bacterium]|nr:30S ribosomal protein S20 [Deltaproteobacteria bacterium]MBW2660741.1 30S ribosomal protein S20 [Deltaproteobacteria bacterium]